ncbi:hypothetical protein PATSB16_29020 [Pandoraea thiooxydans]|nr:hypothetical protein PATSB16_29020 [Pandoraea thiooxydans]
MNYCAQAISGISQSVACPWESFASGEDAEVVDYQDYQ